jgi:hypothetical protein
MANLWRIMAIAWLGGVASPALVVDAAPADPREPPAISQPAAGPSAFIDPDGSTSGGDQALYPRKRHHD